MRMKTLGVGRPELVKRGGGKFDHAERVVVIVKRAEAVEIRLGDPVGNRHTPLIGDDERLGRLGGRAGHTVEQDHPVLLIRFLGAVHLLRFTPSQSRVNGSHYATGDTMTAHIPSQFPADFHPRCITSRRPGAFYAAFSRNT
jgi:hypothetical protein